MKIWNSHLLNKALGVEVPLGIETKHVEFNSKQISGGELFIALTGGATDGHLYVKDALDRGAACAIVSQNLEVVDPNKPIKVALELFLLKHAKSIKA